MKSEILSLSQGHELECSFPDEDDDEDDNDDSNDTKANTHQTVSMRQACF